MLYHEVHLIIIMGTFVWTVFYSIKLYAFFFSFFSYKKFYRCVSLLHDRPRPISHFALVNFLFYIGIPSGTIVHTFPLIVNELIWHMRHDITLIALFK